MIRSYFKIVRLSSRMSGCEILGWAQASKKAKGGSRGRPGSPKELYAPKVYCVPAVLRMNSFGISLLKTTFASNPVQCVGTM